MEKLIWGEYQFTVVDFVPLGYEVWNVRGFVEGYLPLCRIAARQPFPGGRNIETDTLKAIKAGGAEEILAAAGYGFNTLQKMEQCLKRHKNPKPGTGAYLDYKKVRAAIPYARKLKWS